MTLKIIVFEKKKIHLPVIFLVYLLPINIDENAYTAFLAFEKGSFEHILRGQILPSGFNSVFSQVSFEFILLSLFVVIFVTA